MRYDHLPRASFPLVRFVAATAAAAAALIATGALGQSTISADRVLNLTDEQGRRPAVVTAVAVSADGRTIAAGGDDHVVRIWRDGKGEPAVRLRGHEDWVRGLQLDPMSNRLATVGADHQLCLWTLSEGGHELNLSNQLAEGPLSSVAFHPNGEQLVTVGFRDPLRVYSLASSSLDQTLNTPCEDTRAVAVSPDGRWMAAAGRNGRLRLWDLHTGAPGRDTPAATRRVHALAFSPDSSLVAAAGDGAFVRLFDAATGDLAAELPQAAKARSVIFLDAGRLAVGGADNVIRVWDLASNQVDRRLVGHTGAVTSLALDGAGRWLVSGSYDTTVRVWSLGPGGPRSASTAASGTTK
ncbi:MAG: WD40 repeat domain-containing protein [Planctomycetota bacterium]